MSEQTAQNEAPARSTLDIVRSTTVEGTERLRVGKRPPPQKLRGFDFSVAPEATVREAQRAPTDAKFETDELFPSDEGQSDEGEDDTSSEDAEGQSDEGATSDEDEDEDSKVDRARRSKKKIKRKR